MQKTTEIAAGGVLFRRGPRGHEIVVGEQRDRLTGARTLRLPKGKTQGRETLEQAALREVREETGFAGRIVAPLGHVEYTYGDAHAAVAKTVHFFLMECESADSGRSGRRARADRLAADRGRAPEPHVRDGACDARASHRAAGDERRRD